MTGKRMDSEPRGVDRRASPEFSDPVFSSEESGSVPRSSFPDLSGVSFEVRKPVQRQRPASEPAFSKPSRLNTLFSWFIVGFALLAPLPLGSNRPAMWGLLAGLAALGFVIQIALTNPRRRNFSEVYHGAWLLLALAMVQPFWGVVQSLPLGQWVGAMPAALPRDFWPNTITLNPGATLLAATRMTGHVLLFMLVMFTVTRASTAQRIARALFFGILAYGIWGMTNLFLLGDIGIWGPKTDYLGAATGPFINRNSFASFLGLGLILGVVLLIDLDNAPKIRRPHMHHYTTPENLTKIGYALAVLLIFIALVATQSRMGLFASVLGALASALAMSRLTASGGADARKDMGRMTIYAALGLGAVVMVLSGQALLSRSIFATADIGMRMDIFAEAIARIMDRPLQGYGLDSFPLVYEIWRSDASFNGISYLDAHSTYLENWVEAGVLFGSAMIACTFIYMRRLWQVARTRRQFPLSSAAAIGAVVLAATHSTLDFSFEIEANVVVLVIILAMAVAPFRARTVA